MLTAKELHALEQTDLWMDLHHQDASNLNQHQSQNIMMILMLEDLIKQLVILLILIKFQCQHHIQDKTLTTSLKPKELQLRENLKKFQFLIPQLPKPTLHSTGKMMNKAQLKEPQSRESQKKYQSSILQFAKLTLPSTDKVKNKIQPREHQSLENQKKFQSLIPQFAKPTQHSMDKERNNNE